MKLATESFGGILPTCERGLDILRLHVFQRLSIHTTALELHLYPCVFLHKILFVYTWERTLYDICNSKSCVINCSCHSFDIPPCIMCVSFADYIHILAQEDFLFTAKAPLNHRTIRWFCNTKNGAIFHAPSIVIVCRRAEGATLRNCRRRICL